MEKKRIRNIVNPEYLRRGNILRYVSSRDEKEDFKGNPLCVVDSLNYDEIGRCTIKIHLLLKPELRTCIDGIYEDDKLQCVPLCDEIMDSLNYFENKTTYSGIHEYLYIRETKEYPNVYVWFDGKTVNAQSSISSYSEEGTLFSAKTAVHASSLSGLQNLSIFLNINLYGLTDKIIDLEKHNVLSRDTLYNEY